MDDGGKGWDRGSNAVWCGVVLWWRDFEKCRGGREGRQVPGICVGVVWMGEVVRWAVELGGERGGWDCPFYLLCVVVVMLTS